VLILFDNKEIPQDALFASLKGDFYHYYGAGATSNYVVFTGVPIK
jgi:hypothetical protein